MDDEQQIEDNVESTTGSENQKAMNCEPVEESEKWEQSQTGDSNRPEGGVLEDEDDDEIMLIALASNDVASRQIQTDLLTAEERGKTKLKVNVKDRLQDETTGFFETLTKNNRITMQVLNYLHHY